MENSGLNSFSLLRLSITKYIESRYYEIKPPENYISKRKKSRRYKEHHSDDASLVDVHLLKSTLPASFAEKSKMLSKNETVSVKIEDETDNIKPDASQKTFTRMISKSDDSKESEYKQNSQQSESIELKERKRLVKHGLTLARRKFSDSIYENCSTYSLEYSNVSLDKEEISSPNVVLNHFTPAIPTETRLTGLKNAKLKENGGKIYNTEDPVSPVSLGDSFFADVTKDESSSGDSYFRRRTIPQFQYESNKNMASKESDPNMSTDITYDKYMGAHIHQSRERKSSKRYRKRQKNKNKNSVVYECPTCGVSYILSPNALKSTARCLHCDFWTTVEPVFLKREKLPWNICRIS